jgi:rubrerythrin
VPGYYISNALLLLYNKYKGICHICGLFVPIQEATRDHVVPRSKYKELGVDPNTNLALAHRRCNHEKADTYDVVYAASRTTNDPAVHTHSKKSGVVSDTEFEYAQRHQELIVRAVKNTGGGQVLGTTNKRWRCGNCGQLNESEEIVIRHNEYIKKLRYCWFCSTEDMQMIEKKQKNGQV